MTVKNMKGFARDRKYTVIRIVNCEAWFYDAWDDQRDAIRQALEVHGHVIPTNIIEPDRATDSVIDGWYATDDGRSA